MAAESNKLLKIVAIGGVVVALVVGIKAVNHREQSEALQQAAAGPAPDDNGLGAGAIGKDEQAKLGSAVADTPDDKVQTLVAEVKQARKEIALVNERNEQLQKENSDLRNLETRVEDRLSSRFRSKESDLATANMEAQQQQSKASELLANLQAKVDQLSASRPGAGSSRGIGHANAAAGGDIPVGLGIDPTGAAATGGEPVVWIDPLDKPPLDEKGKAVGAYPAALEQGFQSVGQGASKVSSAAANSKLNKPADKPVYTINRDATLVGSVSMTSLIGRIPIGGTVQDPYPFKVLVGSENLAANGITIPGLDSMVISGVASGDWALSCVRGTISSATFVFKDGTIRSYPAPERGKNGNSGGNNQKKQAFGYISDKFGTPCVTGERKTNAVQYLGARIAMAGAQAWAEAEAAAQTTTVISGETATAMSAVTGNPTLYARNKAISGGIEESSQWLKERMAQSFDAIFVRNGTEIAVHIDEEIAIDYEPKGRKVDHHATLPFDSNPNRQALD